MSEADIRNEIVSIMQGISNIGRVHGYKRPAMTEKELFDRYGATISSKKVIRGWTVSRESTDEEWKTMKVKRAREYVYAIEGFWGAVDDDDPAEASETAFQAMIETICDTFRTFDLADLNGKANRGAGPVQVRVVDHRIFGGTLTHHVEMELRARETASAS